METWKRHLGPHDNWHDLPPSLAQATDEGFSAGEAALIALPSDRFATVLSDLLDRASESVAPFNPAYHNHGHFHEMTGNVLTLLEAMDEPAPEAVIQAMLLAAAGHDFGHQGSTLRKDAPKGLLRKELGTDISTEQVSAILVDEVLAEQGLDPAMRTFIARTIWATTFGNTDIGPKTDLERLIVIADVAPNDTFLRWFEKGIDSNLAERPAKAAPTTFTGFMKNRLGFIEYYLEKVLTPEALKLGWGTTLAGYKQQVQRVLANQDPLLTIILKSMLQPYGIDINQ